ncbi:MAG: DsbA family protein [Chloroflexota bacterium]
MADIDVYFDYLCPFAWRSIAWLDEAQRQDPDLQVNWRCFSIEQVNAGLGPDWKLWEQPEDYPSYGLLGLRASVAARRQGGAPYRAFHAAAAEARHVQKRTLTRRATIEQMGREAGLDLARFRQDLDDPRTLAEVGREHEQGVSAFGVFGTPTIVTPRGGALYVQLDEIPAPEQALPLLDDILRYADDRRYIKEIKRPWMGD